MKPIDAPKIKVDCRYYINDQDILQEFYLIGRHPNFPNSRVIAINSPMGDEKKVFDIDDWQELPHDKFMACKALRKRLQENIEELDQILAITS